MVNEINTDIFIVLLVFFALLILASFILNKKNPLRILSAIIATTLGYMLSLMILNGNVTQSYNDATGFHYVPMQSLPIHYILLGLSVIMGLMTVMLVVEYLYTIITVALEDSD